MEIEEFVERYLPVLRKRAKSAAAALQQDFMWTYEDLLSSGVEALCAAFPAFDDRHDDPQKMSWVVRTIRFHYCNLLRTASRHRSAALLEDPTAYDRVLEDRPSPEEVVAAREIVERAAAADPRSADVINLWKTCGPVTAREISEELEVTPRVGRNLLTRARGHFAAVRFT